MGIDKFKVIYEIFFLVLMLNVKIYIEKEIIFRFLLNCVRLFIVCVVDRERY